MTQRANPALNRLLGAGLVLGGLAVGVAALVGTPAQAMPVHDAASGPDRPGIGADIFNNTTGRGADIFNNTTGRGADIFNNTTGRGATGTG
jgi:hypothetical protein